MCLEKLIYEDKSVCLLGCGGSLDKKEIKFENYDKVVGVNRIYKTKYFKKLNILYDSAHYKYDPLNNIKIKTINESNLDYYFLTPGIKSYNILKLKKFFIEKIKIKNFLYKNRPEMKISGKKILAGLFVLNIIIKGCPKKIDLYGFDFYEQNYTSELEYTHDIETIKKMHTLEEEKKYLENLIEKNNFISWSR
jgi:hypothetical protein